ncbi:MAG TPA: diguanylate cyclase [Candidatus Dormibacteraeota bacterium]|nr:diguanylate cyclase [Candidatus Dormibacteraeota bacterium]
MKILIAEDEVVSRRLLCSFLEKEGYEVVVTGSGQEAWDALQRPAPPRLALLDWMMPEIDGLEICRRLRSPGERAYTFILLLTSRDNKADLIRGFEAGADDYLTKPFDPEELKARLRAGLRILKLEDQLVTAREEMHFKATHDTLTTVWNRAGILDIFKRELARSRREGSSITVIMGDLDHFKEVNDAHGHLTGDQVLQEAARRLVASVRSYDIVGRFGGEEFLVLLLGCDRLRTGDRAEHIRAAFACGEFTSSVGNIPLTISLGALATADWPSRDVEEFLREVDLALYRAKAGGRNRTEVAIPPQAAAILVAPGILSSRRGSR